MEVVINMGFYRNLLEKLEKTKKSKLGTVIQFKNLVEELRQKKSEDPVDMWESVKDAAKDPKTLAAVIGRKKFGKERFQEMAAAGRRKK